MRPERRKQVQFAGCDSQEKFATTCCMPNKLVSIVRGRTGVCNDVAEWMFVCRIGVVDYKHGQLEMDY
jgi:hypothetical protein